MRPMAGQRKKPHITYAAAVLSHFVAGFRLWTCGRSFHNGRLRAHARSENEPSLGERGSGRAGGEACGETAEIHLP
eukprot:4136847-Prymnesium_polylepis.1